jgi:8-oxo-dGTP pyrophosphatase MutT (NUDIX family)
MAQKLRAEVCVGAALFRRDRVLLLRRVSTLSAFPGTWDIPGGHVEEGESLLKALRREIREETGFTATVERPFRAGTFDYPNADGRTTRTVEIDFLCSVKSRHEPRLDPAEHTQFAWAGEHELHRYPSPPLLRNIIRAAFASR